MKNIEIILKEKYETMLKNLSLIAPDLTITDIIINPIVIADKTTAKEFLNKSNGNRTKNHKKIRQYKNDMELGRWEINGETVKFDKNGILLDAHHRLQALANIDTPIELELRLNLKNENFKTIDTGKSRSHSDILSIDNIKNFTIISGALRQYYLYVNDILSVSSDVIRSNRIEARTLRIMKDISITNIDIIDLYEKNKDISNCVINNRIARTMHPFSEITALYYIFSRVDKKAAEEFIDIYINGNNLDNNFMIKNLRETMQNNMINNRIDKRMSGADRFYNVIYVWNNFRKGDVNKKFTKQSFVTKLIKAI